jgi:acetyl esterase/lipase
MSAPPPPRPITEMPVVFRVDGMENVRIRPNVVYRTEGEKRLELDAYSPGVAGARPAVILIHGGPVPEGTRAKEWTIFVDYGRMLAASGFVAVAFNHRFHGAGSLDEAAGDVAAAVAYVRGHAEELGVDADRLALWVFSGGGPLVTAPLRDAWPFVRAIVGYYAALDLQVPPPGAASSITDETRRRFSPLTGLSAGEATPPLLIARAGRDNPWLNASIDRFVQEALARNVPLDLMTHPAGPHGFDLLDEGERSREIIARTLDFLRRHLPPRP